MITRLILIAIGLLGIGFVLGRYHSTSTIDSNAKSVPFNAIVRVTGPAETLADGVRYRIRITHLLYQTDSSQNTEYLVTLTLKVTRQHQTYPPGSILKVQGIMYFNSVVLPFKIDRIGFKISKLQRTIFSLRTAFEERILQLLPRDKAILALGMTIGSNYSLEPKLYEALKTNGTIHMLVVSGSNIALLSNIALQMLSRVFKHKYALVATIILTIFYAILSGAQPPIVRAATMSILCSIAQLHGRKADSLWILFFSTVLISSFQPQILSSISFQLSFFATLGICLMPLIHDLKDFKIGSSHIPGKAELLSTLYAQLGVAPLLIYYFQEFSIISFVANMLVAWSVPYIIFLTILAGLTSFISEGIAQIWLYGLDGITAYFTQANLLFARIPLAQLHTKEISLVGLAGIYLIIIAMLAKFRDQN